MRRNTPCREVVAHRRFERRRDAEPGLHQGQHRGDVDRLDERLGRQQPRLEKRALHQDARGVGARRQDPVARGELLPRGAARRGAVRGSRDDHHRLRADLLQRQRLAAEYLQRLGREEREDRVEVALHQLLGKRHDAALDEMDARNLAGGGHRLQRGRDQAPGDERRRAQPERGARGQGARLAAAMRQVLRALQDRARVPHERLAGRRGPHAARGPVEELRAGEPLDLAQALAQGGCAEVHPLRRHAHAARFRKQAYQLELAQAQAGEDRLGRGHGVNGRLTPRAQIRMDGRESRT
jgi:hypothetical protein